ncbi:MAG TPA: response regulator transcription factor [Acidimicrobiales bacterium]|nr:response regulator transcription factor [Acidimicrobiales bacterium]
MARRRNRLVCLICDPCDYFAAGLAAAIDAAASAEVVRVADRRMVPDEVRRRRPDVVIASLEPPGEACELIATLGDVPVLVMSWSVREDQAVEVFRAGGRAFVHKETPVADLLRVMDEVASGLTVLPEARRAQRGPGHLGAPVNDAAAQLTPRESEIVSLLAVGLSNVQIARHMGIAHQTVKNHLHNAMRKLGVSSRLALLLHTKAHRLHGAHPSFQGVGASVGAGGSYRLVTGGHD